MFRTPFPIHYVQDFQRSVEFYNGLLGFQISHRWPAEGAPVYVVLRLDECKLAVMVSSAPERFLGKPVGSGHRFEICVYTDDADASVSLLRSHRAPVLREPADMPWDERRAYVADPDGNPINITAAPRP